MLPVTYKTSVLIKKRGLTEFLMYASMSSYSILPSAWDKSRLDDQGCARTNGSGPFPSEPLVPSTRDSTVTKCLHISLTN